jgi:hypothetical protein
MLSADNVVVFNIVLALIAVSVDDSTKSPYIVNSKSGSELNRTVERNVEGERSLVYCERRNTRETEVIGVGIEPLTKGKIK